jgi:hypothetical protein
VTAADLPLLLELLQEKSNAPPPPPAVAIDDEVHELLASQVEDA